MPLWSVTDTQFPIDSKQGTYINPAYNKKLSTITPTNKTGFVPVDPNSSDPIVKRLVYVVRDDNKVVFGLPQTGTTGGVTQYNNVQELANSGISGYTGNTTNSIKDAMQKNLSASAKEKGVGPAIAPTPTPPGPNSDPQNGPNPTPSNGDPNNQGQTIDTDIGSRTNNYNSQIAENNTLIYPINRKNGNGGDFIKFEILSYKKSGLSNSQTLSRGQATLPGMEYRKRTNLASIYLPIQSGIVEGMSVDWGGGELNPITAAFASAAYSTIDGAKTGLGGFFGGVSTGANTIKDFFDNAGPELRQFAVNYFTEQSVKTSGLLSRTLGAAINNNLELLFNGPMLRSFTFNFKLTPREQKEALVIREMIRWFKKSMAPGLSTSQLFLLAPNVFKISYVYTGKGNLTEDHPYLNRIKVAALRDIAVNYTPDGNYMTYQDGSMTQYDLNLTFGEIDPIFENDYEINEGLIGTGW